MKNNNLNMHPETTTEIIDIIKREKPSTIQRIGIEWEEGYSTLDYLDITLKLNDMNMISKYMLDQIAECTKDHFIGIESRRKNVIILHIILDKNRP